MLVLTNIDGQQIGTENDRHVQHIIESVKRRGLDPTDWTNGYLKLQDTADLSKSAPVGHPFYGNQYKKIADLDDDVGAAEHDVDTDVDVSAPKPTLTFVPFHDLSLGDKKQHLVQEHGQSLGSVAGQTQGGLEGIHQGLVASASHFHQPEKKSKVPVVPFYSEMDLPTKQKHMAYEHGNYLEWLKHQTEGAMNTMHAADHALGGASMLPHTHTPAPTVSLAQKTVKAMSLAPGDVVHFESGKDRVVEKVFSTAGNEREVTFTDGYWQYYQDDEMVLLTSEAGNSQPDTHMQAKDVKAGDVIQVGVGGQIRTVQKVERLGIDGLKITYTDGLVTYPALTTIVRRISSDPEGAAQAEEAAKAEAAAKADMQAEEIAKNPQKWFQLSLGEKVNHLNGVEHAILPYGANIDALHGSIYDPLTCTLSPEYLAPEKRFDKQYAAATTLEDKLRLIQKEFLAPWWEGEKRPLVPALEDIKTTEQADKLRKFLVDYRTNFHNGAAKENPLGRAVPGPKPFDFNGSHMPSLLEEDSKYWLEDLWNENWSDWHSYYDDAVDNEENTSFKQLSAMRVAAEMSKLIPQSEMDRYFSDDQTSVVETSQLFINALHQPNRFWFAAIDGEIQFWPKSTYTRASLIEQEEGVTEDSLVDGANTAKLQRMKNEYVVSQLIHNWAVSSNDANAVALAIQEAAAKEFGVEDITADTDDWRLFDARNRGWAALEKRTDEQTKVNGRLFRAFVRAQYNATQKWFKENHITKITLFRKQSIPFNLTVPADGEEATFPLRPLSSWSYDYEGASNFSGSMMSITVPVSRVLSTTNTGNGCSNEHEIVLIGGTDTINVMGENDY